MLRLVAKDNAVELGVKVVPGASRTRYQGEWDGMARIAVAAPPEKGKANTALTEFLAKLLGVRKTEVQVIRGQTATIKTIRIEGVTAEAVNAALQADRS